MNVSFKKLTVLLVEHDYPIENTVKDALHDDPSFEYLGCVKTRDALEKSIIDFAPDLILIDLLLPVPKSPKEPFRKELNFNEGLLMLSMADKLSPQSKVIAFSDFIVSNSKLAKEALKSGADALLPKQNAPSDHEGWCEWFKYNLLMISKGEWQPDAIVARLLDEEEEVRVHKQANDNEYERLSERERAVLKLVAEGKNDDEIGAALFIAPTTVRSHIRNILIILHLRNRQHLKESFRGDKRITND